MDNNQDKWTFDEQSQIWLPKNKVRTDSQLHDAEMDEYIHEERKKLTNIFSTIRGGAIGISCIIMQGFLSVELKSATDFGAIFALAISIPVLATAILLKHQGYSDDKRIFICDTIGLFATYIGIFFTFIHFSYYAGLVSVVSMMAGFFIFARDY